MPFASWRQYKKFAEFVTKQFRHVLDAENQAFITAVLETSKRRVRVLRKGTCLWRAQRGHDIRNAADDVGLLVDQEMNKWPHPPKRMAPRPDRAYEGRVNPKGLPCLYCATERETAMTEVRPWRGAFVSVAQLVTERQLNLVDCSREWEPEAWKLNLLLDEVVLANPSEPDPEKREQCVWDDINESLSQPVSRSDDEAEYAPTQIIAEVLRSAGHDGIAYKSSVGKGENIAIFDLSAARITACCLHRVENVNLAFSPAIDLYDVVDGEPVYRDKFLGETDESGANAEAGQTG